MTGATIWDGVATVVCDLDGVVYLGEEGIPGSGEALASLESQGVGLLFVTNNSSRTPEEAAAKIERTVGYAAAPSSIVTSGQVTAARLAGQAATAYVVGSQGIVSALEAHGIESVADWRVADAVVVGLDKELSYERLAGATLAVGNGALFHATNSDTTLPTPEGLTPGAGAIAAAIAVAADRDPIVSGKPHRAMIDYVAAIAAKEVLVVGDRLDTDIAMAREAGWRSALVLTGVSRLEDIDARIGPDLAVGSLVDLVQLRG